MRRNICDTVADKDTLDIDNNTSFSLGDDVLIVYLAGKHGKVPALTQTVKLGRVQHSFQRIYSPHTTPQTDEDAFQRTA